MSQADKQTYTFAFPRLMVTALSGGGGKTTLTLGLIGALREAGCDVLPFKKGPDYIDPAWMSVAAGKPATNLDPYFLSPERLRSLFVHASLKQVSNGSSAVCIIEGNRGLFDGLDVKGSCSTAMLARELASPLVLSLNVTKMTRTAAALIQGILGFEKGLTFAGVVLNQVGRARHASYLRQAIETYTDMPVLGEIPRFRENPLPERHMGLASLLGNRLSDTAIASMAALSRTVREHVDIDRVLEAARRAPALTDVLPFWTTPARRSSHPPVIGYVRDQALWFYYPENLEGLERAGARLVRLSFFDEEPWPFDGEDALDAVYLGGGFPEDYLSELSRSPRLAELAGACREGFPVYAECGGLMTLSRSITKEGTVWPMAGVLPVDIEIFRRPQGLGYVDGHVLGPNPYFPKGLDIRGHEFHFSRVLGSPGSPALLSLSKGWDWGTAAMRCFQVMPGALTCMSLPRLFLNGQRTSSGLQKGSAGREPASIDILPALK